MSSACQLLKTAHFDSSVLLNQVLGGQQDHQSIYLDASPAYGDDLNVQSSRVSHPEKFVTPSIKATINKVENLALEKGISQYVLTLHDYSSQSLKACDYEFAEIVIYQNELGENFADLSTFMGSDLGGKKCLSLVQEVLKTLDVSRCFLDDQAFLMTHHCCEEGVPHSLKLAEVFKRGKSWYQKQGAHLPFLLHLEDDNLVKVFASSTNGYGVFSDQQLNKKCEGESLVEKLNHSLNVASHNYQESCLFLFNLEFFHLKSALSKYLKVDYFRKLFELLEKVQELTSLSDENRVGEAVEKLTQLDQSSNSTIHSLKHEFMQKISDFNYELFSKLVSVKLDECVEKKSNWDLGFYLTHALLFTASRFNMLQEMCHSKDDENRLHLVTILENDKFKREDRQTFLADRMSQYGEKTVANWQMLKEQLEQKYEPGSCSLFKYFQSNDSSALKKWNASIFGENVIPLFLKTLDLFKKINIKQIETFAPHFCRDLNQRLQKNIFMPESDSPILEAIQNQKDSSFQKEVLYAVINYLAEQVKLINYDFILQDPERKLEAFVFAKNLVQGHSPLELPIK